MIPPRFPKIGDLEPKMLAVWPSIGTCKMQHDSSALSPLHDVAIRDKKRNEGGGVNRELVVEGRSSSDVALNTYRGVAELLCNT